jgi:hypothetical protein
LSTGSQQVFYTVSSSRAYFLTTVDPADTSNVEDGTADLQQSSAFSNATLKGQYAFKMSGFNATSNFFVDRVGWIQWDGTSAISLSEDVNDSGNGGVTSGVLTGTYAVGANGRTTATITNFSLSSNDFVAYLVSGSQGYLLQSDTGIEISGQMTLQQ